MTYVYERQERQVERNYITKVVGESQPTVVSVTNESVQRQRKNTPGPGGPQAVRAQLNESDRRRRGTRGKAVKYELRKPMVGR